MRLNLQNTILFLSLIFIVQSVEAQIGIRAKYLRNGIDDSQANYINEIGGIEDALTTGYGLGVDYWFRLKNNRIEFLPELGINYSQTSVESVSGDLSIDYNYLYFNLNTRIYPMDFEGDCDCPTFSNQSTLIKKGFYFELSPGIGYYTSHHDSSLPTETLTASEDAFSYKLGLAVGLDIGVSNLLTINPYAMYNSHFGRNYSNPVSILNSFIGFKEEGTAMSQIELGVRFAIRFDAKNY